MRTLVAKEKHGDRHFAVPDDEALGRAALKLLKERSNEGWFSSVEDIEREKRRAFKSAAPSEIEAAVLATDLDTIPEPLRSSVKATKERLAVVAAAIDDQYDEELTFAEQLKTLLSSPTPDLAVARQLLLMRADYEYEGYRIIETEEV